MSLQVLVHTKSEFTAITMHSFYNIFSNFQLCHYLQPLFNLASTNPEVCIKNQKIGPESLNRQLSLDEKGPDDEDDVKVSKAEINMVMSRLGISTDYDYEKEKLSSKELSELFEGKEPSLEEVKEAFHVFDEKKDGFIDAAELQRVLCCLGLKEGLEEDKCRNMIRAADENGDDLIDFEEFVKLMEKCFC